MRPRSRTIAMIVLAAILFAIGTWLNASSAATGRIAGTITDAETGDPVIGASVLVVGTQLGAQTDFDGKFVIQQVVPGTHTIRISHLEYQSIEVRKVTVEADSTVKFDYQLKKKSADLREPIKVTGRQDQLKMYGVSNQATIVGKGEPSFSIPYAPPYPPAHGGTAIVNGEPYDAMFFKNHGVNPFVDTEDDHLSTFAIDVDDASYIMARSYLEGGHLPNNDAVRTEEFVNHFDYNYPAPSDEAFRIYMDGAPSYFGQNTRLLRVGIKGQEVRPEDRKPANLVFVIDISGSMSREDRLGLVKRALRELVDQLDQRDRVGIVVYGSRGEVYLPPTGIAQRYEILSAIERLAPNGATNAEEGLRLGYEMAGRMFEKGKINRIILCSDGVANVGRTGPDDILKQIKSYAERGITLTTVGFGMGNYNDVLMEKLGNKGNGFYAYVDDIAEARRIFVDNLTGTLQVIARDVKIQVDFNPDYVRSYRLLGYENRDVDDDKFRDDKEDGGEIGSGHEVTALYEIKFWDRPTETSDRIDMGTVYVRYKDPDHGEVTEVRQAFDGRVFNAAFASASTDLKLAAAAAEFAEILRKSHWAKESSLDEVMAVAKEVSVENDSPEVIEFLNLISKARQFEEGLAEK